MPETPPPLDKKTITEKLTLLDRHNSVSPRDQRVLETLAAVKIFSLNQAWRMFWPESAKPETARVRLSTLINKYGLLEGINRTDWPQTSRAHIEDIGLVYSRTYKLAGLGREWLLTRKLNPGRKPKQNQAAHDLLVAEIRTRLEEARLARGAAGWRVAWYGERDAGLNIDDKPVILPDGLGILTGPDPDAAFAFFLEIDASRESHVRPSSRIGRKIGNYARFVARWPRHTVQQREQLPHFPPVLFVLNGGEERLQNLVGTILKNRRGPVGIALARRESLFAGDDLFTCPAWLLIQPGRAEILGQNEAERQPLFNPEWLTSLRQPPRVARVARKPAPPPPESPPPLPDAPPPTAPISSPILPPASPSPLELIRRRLLSDPDLGKRMAAWWPVAPDKTRVFKSPLPALFAVSTGPEEHLFVVDWLDNEADWPDKRGIYQWLCEKPDAKISGVLLVTARRELVPLLAGHIADSRGDTPFYLVAQPDFERAPAVLVNPQLYVLAQPGRSEAVFSALLTRPAQPERWPAALLARWQTPPMPPPEQRQQRDAIRQQIEASLRAAKLTAQWPVMPPAAQNTFAPLPPPAWLFLTQLNTLKLAHFVEIDQPAVDWSRRLSAYSRLLQGVNYLNLPEKLYQRLYPASKQPGYTPRLIILAANQERLAAITDLACRLPRPQWIFLTPLSRFQASPTPLLEYMFAGLDPRQTAPTNDNYRILWSAGA